MRLNFNFNTAPNIHATYSTAEREKKNTQCIMQLKMQTSSGRAVDMILIYNILCMCVFLIFSLTLFVHDVGYSLFFVQRG